jgi:nucleoside-diphosphate-sugar epimerase
VKILVTGSAGHLGEALMRTLTGAGHQLAGLDIRASPFTQHVGSIAERRFVDECMRGVEVVLHTATLHKPHIETHSRQDFLDTNVTGTLNLLEAAVAAGAKAFVYTSTTSTFGHALVPAPGEPAAWITEDVVPVPKNIYGITKLAAENLCELIHRQSGMPCLVLRTARFFPEEDDSRAARDSFDNDNLKVNELLHRRADIEDVVTAHLCAMERAATIGFDRFIISATSPFAPSDLPHLRVHPERIVRRLVPAYERVYSEREWSLPREFDRVYVNESARDRLGWQPRYDFSYAVTQLLSGNDYRSPLAVAVGAKGYHFRAFTDGPYPVSV